MTDPTESQDVIARKVRGELFKTFGAVLSALGLAGGLIYTLAKGFASISISVAVLTNRVESMDTTLKNIAEQLPKRVSQLEADVTILRDRLEQVETQNRGDDG